MSAPPAPPRKISLAKHGAASASAAPENTTQNAYGDGLTLVMMRNEFYSSGYYKLVKIMGLQLLSLVMIGAVIMRLFSFTNARDYFFPVREDNQLIIEQSMSLPVYTHDALAKWLEKAITESFTFGYYDYAARLQEARGYFTTIGFANFLNAIDKANIFGIIGAKSSATPDSQVLRTRIRPEERPKVIAEGVSSNGHYVWKVALGININFVSQQREHRETWNIEATVVRVPITMGRYGIGIDQVIVTTRTD